MDLTNEIKDFFNKRGIKVQVFKSVDKIYKKMGYIKHDYKVKTKTPLSDDILIDFYSIRFNDEYRKELKERGEVVETLFCNQFFLKDQDHNWIKFLKG